MKKIGMKLVVVAIVGLFLGGCVAPLSKEDQAKLDAALKAADSAAASAQSASASAQSASASADRAEAAAKRAEAAAASAEDSAAKAAKAFEMGLRK